MKILIIGDPYFLSKEVGKLLFEQGHELMFYDITIRPNRGLEELGKTVIAAPDNDYSMRVTFSSFKPEAVFWLGVTNLDHLNNYNPIDDYKQFISSIMTLCETVSLYRVEHILFRSSYEVYGSIKTRRQRLSETDICNPITHRGAAIKAAEDILRVHCYSNNIRLTSFRVFEAYGNEPTEAPSGLAPAVIRSFVEGFSVGVPHAKSYRDFVHVEDAARAMVLSFTGKLFGPVNIGSGLPVKVSKLLSSSYKLSGKSGCIIDIENDKWPTVSSVANIDRLKFIYTPSRFILDDIPEMIDFYRERLNVR